MLIGSRNLAARAYDGKRMIASAANAHVTAATRLEGRRLVFHALRTAVHLNG